MESMSICGRLGVVVGWWSGGGVVGCDRATTSGRSLRKQTDLVVRVHCLFDGRDQLVYCQASEVERVQNPEVELHKCQGNNRPGVAEEGLSDVLARLRVSEGGGRVRFWSSDQGCHLRLALGAASV